MIIDEEEYLKHHGVKGMRWGERRAARKTAKKNRTPAERQKAQDKTVLAVTGIGLMAYGTLVLGSQYLKSKKGRESLARHAKKVYEKRSSSQVEAGRIFVKDFIDVTYRVA